MGKIQFQIVSLTALLILATTGAIAGDSELVDAPIRWHDDDRRPIPMVREREPSLNEEYVAASVLRPVGRTLYPPRILRNIGTLFGGDHVLPAHNINALDEVPNSSWFTNRIGLFPMSVEDAARGVGTGSGPDRGGAWTIISAKTEGVTPGFIILDGAGQGFLIKFDAKQYPGTATGAGAISGRIFHAIGYNVPDDTVVHFRRERLRIREGVELRGEDGKKRPMTEADLEAILARVPQMSSGEHAGEYRAISSRFVEGKPVGPFNYLGRRGDDANDRISHEHRRELRGLRVFSAWLYSFDTKQHNSLDSYVGEPGAGHVKHHLIDFASTLGTGASGPLPRYNHEYTASLAGFTTKLLSFGIAEDTWRKIQSPEGLDEVGYIDVEHFDPGEFRPLQPNSAFSNLTDRDAYWAAKIVSAFSDEQILAICESAQYENPGATAFVAKALAGRRDIVARHYFDKIAPLDFFQLGDEGMRYHDLGAERGIYPNSTPRYRTRVAACSAGRSANGFSEWTESTETVAAVGAIATDRGNPFGVIELQVNRGDGWSSSVKAYFAPQSRRVVAVSR
jgi:hypothetical protein